MNQDAAENLGGVHRLPRLDLVPVDAETAAELAGGWCQRPCLVGYPHEGTTPAAAATYAAITCGLARTGFGMFLLTRRDDALVVGDAGFHGPPLGSEVEIGYGLAPSARGFGYATEAVQALCDLAFAAPDVERVLAETEVANVASQAVLRRAGFVPDDRERPESGLLTWVRRR